VRPGEAASRIEHVTFHLHPTFAPASVRVAERPFQITRVGWGTFDIGIEVVTTDGECVSLRHALSLEKDVAAEFTIRPTTCSTTPTTPTSSVITTTTNNAPTMTGVSVIAMHGQDGVGHGWAPPFIITKCDKKARPGYNSMKAHEYAEQPETLRAKVKMLAALLRKSKHCIAYTGAGISTASGIDDYASGKTQHSAATGAAARKYRPKAKKGLDAEPTFAHYTLAALAAARNGSLVKHWIQQNHDGLPQKAGFAQSKINEIHGAWFDPSNPVVPMDGSLRDDLYAWMLREEQLADLVLTMGTSLCGMNADRVVETASRKRVEHGIGLGSVIIGFQRTQLDDICSLRIFARIDEVMLLLAREMQLDFGPTPLQSYDYLAARRAGAAHPADFVYVGLPYDASGQPSQDPDAPKLTLDLSLGAEVVLTAGPGKGYRGTIQRTPSKTGKVFSWTVRCPCTRENSPQQGKEMRLYPLGAWYLEDAMKGELGQLPVVNTRAWAQKRKREAARSRRSSTKK